MTTRHKPKTFDCLEFKRKAQAEIYGEIKDLTPQQQIDYFKNRAKSGVLGELWKNLQNRASADEFSKGIAPPTR